MKKMMRSLMAMCFLAVSLTAFAQSGDAMKQDSMKTCKRIPGRLTLIAGTNVGCTALRITLRFCSRYRGFPTT